VHYQQMDSTTVYMQGYAKMKIQRIIWKSHGVSRSYNKDFVMGRQLTKSIKNRQGFKWCSSRWKSIVRYHYRHFQEKKLRRTTT